MQALFFAGIFLPPERGPVVRRGGKGQTSTEYQNTRPITLMCSAASWGS